jgi:polysaccharide biosynthesis protein PslH
MRILMVSSFLPYPLFSGGQVRLYNLIKELSEKHEITLICEKRSHQTEADVREIEKICKKVVTVGRRRQWGVGNILKTAASANSFLVTGHTSKEMKKKIEEELQREKFDLIHVETFYVMQNLPSTILPVVLAEHNIEYAVYDRFAKSATMLVKPLLLLDIAKLKREEEALWKKATRVVAVSNEDKKVMTNAGLTPAIVANGVDTQKFSFNPLTRSARSGQKKILFLGDFKWLQNRDAAKFIIEEIWPILRQGFGGQAGNTRDNGLKLWIVGRKIPESIKNLAIDSNIIFDEESSVKPTEELFHEADILLAPIRIGGGTSYKILESMSCGTPVVTMPLSSIAIEARGGHDIMVGETPSELSEKTLSLLSDESLYKKIAVNGRKLIEEKYTWKKIAEDLDEVYNSVI